VCASGDVFSHPTLLVPKVADRENLAKFYEAVRSILTLDILCYCV